MKKFFLLLIAINVFTASVFAVGGDLGASKGANGQKDTPWLIEDFEDFECFSMNFTRRYNYWAGGLCQS